MKNRCELCYLSATRVDLQKYSSESNGKMLTVLCAHVRFVLIMVLCFKGRTFKLITMYRMSQPTDSLDVYREVTFIQQKRNSRRQQLENLYIQ